MIVMKENGGRARVEGEEIVSIKNDDFEALPSVLQPVLTRESLSRELPTSSPNVAHPASSKSSNVDGNASVNENSWSDGFL